MKIIAPGSTIGIIGGGQLGRMLALAAAPLGYRVHILDPDPSCCAALVAADFTIAAYEDVMALARFADAVDVATYEFENVDADPLEIVAEHVSLFPPLAALRTAQDRIAEKKFAAEQGARPAPWASVMSRADLDAALSQIGSPSVLKTTRFGYDGKGQARIQSLDGADIAWHDVGGHPAILEGIVTFEHEFSILVARGQDGSNVAWDTPENVHINGILATSNVPPHNDIAMQVNEAKAIAIRIADALAYVGVLAIEFFASADALIFNEMAPRVHNSGHWTIEGAVTSQFENHIRAICGLPLGPTDLTAPKIVMENLIGDDIEKWPQFALEPGAHLHLYGKGAPSPGRKMGHVTRLG